MGRAITPLVAGVLLGLAWLPEARAQQPTIIITDPTYLDLRAALYSGLANQVGTLPNPTGGAFTYEFDPATGIFQRTTENLGPIFAERADTTGRNKFTFTASFTRHTFDEVDGVDVRDEGVTVPLLVGGAFETRLNVLQFRESVDADVGTIGFLYGATDRIDVGITIPIVRVKLKERVRRTGFIDCVGPPQLNLQNCSNFVPRDDALIPQEEENFGLGDIVLRGKYNPWRWNVGGGRLGVAAALDVKLPTGDEGDRRTLTGPGTIQFVGDSTRVVDSFIGLGDPPLGTGIVRVKPQLIASGNWFGLEPHVNVGVELGTTTGITNDLVYAVGAEYTLFGRVGIIFDFLGRHAFDVERRKVANNVGAAGKANADTITASIGLKANPFGTLIIFANLLVPLNDTGARDDLTPTVGLEWSF